MMALRMHVQALGDALRRFARQPLVSGLSVVVLALAIALPVIATVLLRSVGAATARLDTDPHINVYLALEANAEDVKRVQLALQSHPDTAAVRFIPRDQALAELKATTHLADVLASLDRNPLPDAFTVRLRTTDPDRLAALRASWGRLPKVDQVAADFEWSQRLARWVSFARRIVGGIGLFLGVAVLFIVGHLIRLQVLTRKDEIEVSRLVGATIADVRRPFLYHGLLQGVFAGAGALAAAAAMAAWIRYELSALTPDYAAELKVLFLDPTSSALLVAGAGLLALAGAWIAVSRELHPFPGNR